MKYPYEDCPQFDICSAPKCPLDPDYHMRTARQKGEERCNARKTTRLKIAKMYPEITLPYQGMTGREFSANQARISVETQNSAIVEGVQEAK